MAMRYWLPSGNAIGCLIAVAVLAEEPAAPREDASPAPVVGLDALLRLPGETRTSPDTSGPTASDRLRWEERFRAARNELAEARAELSGHQRALEELAATADHWQVAAPGADATAENSPISYKLRQEIRESREEVARTERQLQDLEVEASLAGVPAEWRDPVEDAVAEPGS